MAHPTSPPMPKPAAAPAGDVQTAVDDDLDDATRPAAGPRLTTVPTLRPPAFLAATAHAAASPPSSASGATPPAVAASSRSPAPPGAGSPPPPSAAGWASAPAPPAPVRPAARVTKLDFVAGRPLSGRYQMLRKLGEGGMGTVYLADDLLLRRMVAVKTLFEEELYEAADIDRFRKEVALTHAISHPNVARTYDLGETGGVHFITMEYLKGETLMGRIRRGVMGSREVVDVARAICKALQAAHGVGVIHRDLKPANIMLVPDGRRAVVMDFGIARNLADARGDDLTRPHQGQDGPMPSTPWDVTSAGLGTPAYMAPEQWDQKGGDERTDLYALGVILFVCLTGQAPFVADSPTMMGQAHKTAPIPDVGRLAKDVAPDLAAVIKACLQKRQQDRPRRVDDVLYMLDRRTRLRQYAARLAGIVTGAAVALAGLGLAVFTIARGAILTEMGPAQLHFAELIARDLDVRDLDAVRGPGDMATPAFARANAVLKTRLADKVHIRDIYTMRPAKTPGWLEHVVVAHPEAFDMDGDGIIGEGEEGALPGKLFNASPFPEIAAALTAGKATAETEFTYDSGAFTLGGFSPVPANTKNAPYLVGVDVFNQQLATLMLGLIVATATVFVGVVATAGVLLHPRWLRRIELRELARKRAAHQAQV
ncbi:MAG: serine/threonine protein kinase [Myxococcales bacterium]|nr:serine/threonine protein kinase [Myxococcales bacterium]